MPASWLRSDYGMPRLLAVLALSAGGTATLGSSDAPAHVPAGAWAVSGPCHVASDDDCVTSPHYDQDGEYGDDQACNMSYVGTSTRFLQVESFDTEASCDFLTIGGDKFSGDLQKACLMQGRRLDGDVITWSSDYSNTKRGWKICARAPSNAWRVSGSCRVDQNDDGCVVSPGYPLDYSEAQGCCASFSTDATTFVEADFSEASRLVNSSSADLHNATWQSTDSRGERITAEQVTHSKRLDGGDAIAASVEGFWYPGSWKICARAAGDSWSVSGVCQVAEDDDACVTSPNYPGGYEGDQECVLTWRSSATRFLDLQFSDDVQVATCPMKMGILSSSDVALGPSDFDQGMKLPGMITLVTGGICSPGSWKVCAREVPPVELPMGVAWLSLAFISVCWLLMCCVAWREFSKPVVESHVPAEAPVRAALYEGPYRAQDAASGSFECQVPQGSLQGTRLRCRSPFGNTMSVALPADAAAGQWVSAVDAVQRTERPSDLAARQESVRAALEVQRREGGTSGAEFLHAAIGAEFWGVTMAAFVDFMASVRARRAAGELTNEGRVPYPQERFDSPSIGPNMYQVNEQVIKPITAGTLLELPGVSWALMSEAVGNMVTLFVTHAWAEGAYEFERKLLDAWPKGADGCHLRGAAYICFLSNPQNLNISQLLMEIETSPFNIALQRMPKPGRMLMIATENTPIHERLWCVFEAHLAIELEIPITLGGSQEELAVNRNAAASAMGHADALTESLEKYQKRMRSQLQAFAAFSCFGILLTVAAFAGYQNKNLHVGVDVLFICMLVTMCRRRATRQQMLELSKAAKQGQLMDVRRAQCTSDDDARKIRAAIRGQEGEINSMLGRIIVFGSAPRSDNVV